MDLWETGKFQESLKYLDLLNEKNPHFELYNPIIRTVILSDLLKEKNEYGDAISNDYDSRYDTNRIDMYGISNNGNFFLSDKHRFSAYDNEGNLLVQNDFESELLRIRISNDGNYAACVTFGDERVIDSNTLFFFSLERKERDWGHKLNPNRPNGLHFDLTNQILYAIYDLYHNKRLSLVKGEVRYGYSFNGDFLDAARFEKERIDFLSDYSKLNLAEKKIKELDISNSDVALYDEILDLLNSIDDESKNTQAEVQRCIGEMYYKKGDYTLAIENFENALSLNPKVGVKRKLTKLKQRMNDSYNLSLVKKKSRSTRIYKSSCTIQPMDNENPLNLIKEIQTTKK